MRKYLAIALLMFGLLQLGVRGVQRARHDIPLWDFASVYSASRAWLSGENPYDVARVVATWRAGGIFADRDAGTWATVYPPTSLAMIAPLAILPPAIAMTIWCAIVLALLVAQFFALFELADLSWRDSRALLLIGASLASAPLQFGLLSGQLSMPAISLCIIALALAKRSRPSLAGILIGAACAIKPQLAGIFIIYCLTTRRFRVASFAVAALAIIGVISLAAMQLSHIDWITGWTNSIAASKQAGGVNDYGFAGAFRDEIIDLKLVLTGLSMDPRTTAVAVGCVTIGLLAWLLRAFPRRELLQPRTELLAIAAVCAISLLPLYHRVYDAALLSTALLWALIELDGVHHWLARFVLIAMSPLLVPFDLTQSIGNRLPNFLELARRNWWQSIVAPLYAWSLLAIVIALLSALSALAMRVAPAAQAGVFAEDDEDEAMLAH